MNDDLPSTLYVASVGWSDPAGVGLRAALSRELDARYADLEPDPALLPKELTVAPDTVVFAGIAYRRGIAMGHIALRRLGPELELKNMYVAPEARGTGVSVALLAAAEEAARRVGARRIILQTGVRQPEAIRLYERQGYVRIPIYPPFEELIHSRCFEKVLGDR